jgi:hypothetical protein
MFTTPKAPASEPDEADPVLAMRLAMHLSIEELLKLRKQRRLFDLSIAQGRSETLIAEVQASSARAPQTPDDARKIAALWLCVAESMERVERAKHLAETP